MLKDFKNIDNKMNYQILGRFFKILLIKLILLLFILNQNAFSKPLPPGSGSGDTPANILILLDTSASMQNKPFGGESMAAPGGIVLLDSGDVVTGQSESEGLSKFSYTSELYDENFADGEKQFLGDEKDTSCSLHSGQVDSRLRNVGAVHISKKVSGQGTNEVIYGLGANTGNVVGVDADGNCIHVISSSDLGFSKGGVRGGRDDRILPISMDIATNGSNDIMVVTGYYKHCNGEKTTGRGKRRKKICSGYDYAPFWYTKNLTTLSEGLCDAAGRSSEVIDRIWHGKALQIDPSNNFDSAAYAYWVDEGKIWRYPVVYDANQGYCPSTTDTALKKFEPGQSGNIFASPTRIQLDPQSETIMYLTSSDHKLQKLTISESKLTVTKTGTTNIEVGGTMSRVETPASAANEALSSEINLFSPSAIHVSNDRVWIAGSKISIQEFDISGGSIQWVDEMGSSKISRAKGAQIAIKKIVTDSSLLTGARFGYGWWNAGTEKKKKGKAKDKWCAQCEYTCNKECPFGKGNPKKKWFWNCNNNCDYYRGWGRVRHPFGQSTQCDTSSCLKVGISKNNSQRIIDAVDDMVLEFGTDANAFAQMGYEYFRDFKDEFVDCTSECLLNYVIVIGDGAWRHQATAIPLIEKLRTEFCVKTLFVAYGGGISGKGMDKFDEAARAGSCDNLGDPDCRATIVADDPSALLTKLKSEIERIIASKLSFSAPAITANIEGKGDLFQAQFEHTTFKEWTGHLVRKHISETNEIEHDLSKMQNWDAADAILAQAQLGEVGRNIWTAMEGAPYIGNWNNFKVANKTHIDKLFRVLGNSVSDYHNTNSNCKDEPGVEDGNDDDIEGLINFVRGYDYFAYGGCKEINNIRSHVLGDIYHSQLVEVGKPSANTFFTANNQEAYWRSINGYQSFALSNETRQRVIYVGANDGMLHAIDPTEDGKGKELWAFVPPFIAARLPELINEDLDGLPGGRGGTNAIFAVDGSPVVHDMFIRGLKSNGEWEEVGQKSWHTILFIPYGRGGNGFSVLQVTDPLKPLHLFSLYNDKERGKILIAESNGKILNDDEAVESMIYKSGTYHVRESLEAERANRNEQRAYLTDIAADDTGDTTDARDNIAICQENTEASSGSFHIDGTASCYKGKKFTFKFNIPQSILDNPGSLIVETEDPTLSVESFTQDGAFAVIEFKDERVYNISTSPETDLNSSDSFRISLPPTGTEDKQYDYSKLGETWSTPRIIRLPVDEDPANDIYTAVLPGGFGQANGVGSGVFLVNLSDMATAPGALVTAGPIEIVDLDTSVRDDDGNLIQPDIHNAILGDPVVITPDTFRGAKWRGAMVYINDLEGKITKINLTSAKEDGLGGSIELYDTTTLYYLNTNHRNGRLSYFGMDAAFGTDTKNLFLFGSTGDYSDIAGKDALMDNIIYGIRDRNFPNFVHLAGSDISDITIQDVKDGNVKTIDDEDNCAHTHYNWAHGDHECAIGNRDAWMFKLDHPWGGKFEGDICEGQDCTKESTSNRYRKASASPTVYKGTVYYPIYEPPAGAAACGVGDAFICSADDECGTNTSENLVYAQKTVREESRFDDYSGCYYLQPGILSRLVVFNDTLFANITTDSTDQKDTLITLLSDAGEIEVYKGSWRENY